MSENTWCIYLNLSCTTYLAKDRHKTVNSGTDLFWNMTKGSASRSFMSMSLPLAMTSGCLRLMSQPMWEKKKPLWELCGSPSVSLWRWCWRWSRTQMYRQFCANATSLMNGINKLAQNFSPTSIWRNDNIRFLYTIYWYIKTKKKRIDTQPQLDLLLGFLITKEKRLLSKKQYDICLNI